MDIILNALSDPVPDIQNNTIIHADTSEDWPDRQRVYIIGYATRYRSRVP